MNNITVWGLSKFLRASSAFHSGFFDFTPTNRYNTGETISVDDQEDIINLHRRLLDKYELYRRTMDFTSAADLSKAEVLYEYLINDSLYMKVLTQYL